MYELIGQVDPGATSPTWAELRERLRTMIAERAGQPEWGRRVFVMEIPLEFAPTLNRYGSMAPWIRKKLYNALDIRIIAARPKWPGCILKAPRRRGVIVTRHSSRRPDELGVDVIGGKVPIDRLVHAMVLAGDSDKHLLRDAVWTPAQPDEGKLVIEVFELT